MAITACTLKMGKYGCEGDVSTLCEPEGKLRGEEGWPLLADMVTRLINESKFYVTSKQAQEVKKQR